MGANVKLVGKWRDLLNATDPADFERRIVNEVARAHKRMGRRFVKDARAAIRAGAYARNSPITVLLKGSSRPLVAGGTLFQGITWDLPDPYLLRVGVLRTKAEDKTINIAATLHDGATIDTRRHPQVRRKLWAMVRDAVGNIDNLRGRRTTAARNAAKQLGLAMMAPDKKRRQLRYLYATGKLKRRTPPSSGAGIIVIPPRPFLLTPLQAPGFVEFVRSEYEQAVKRALFPGGTSG